MTPGDLPLIRTKLAPPRVGSAPVSRDALLQQLDERRSRRLTVVLGPAGCGKTMLLTQWRRQLILQGAKVAWYNAGVDDNDMHIAAYIVESLQQSGLVMDKEALHVYLRSGGKAWRSLVASLVNDIGDQEGDVYLVIDDLHHISSFGVLKLLGHWLAMAPERFHLVLGSRNRPPLPLARLRAEDDLTELQFSELRFSRDETHRFLQAQGLQGLSAAQENRLQEMTDGWAAGLQLLAFSLRKQKNPEQFFERRGQRSLSRADALEEYLETAVVEHLSEAEFSFLMRISVCRRFNRELCELLTGDPRTAEHLARFENENLFLIPIDTADTEPWYRFHRLFAGFLNNRLQRIGEAEVRKIHHLASHWFAGKNLHTEAMRHATLAGDTDFVVQLIDRAARQLVSSANFAELLKWCDAVPRESLLGRLNVLLCVAWAQLTGSRVESFERTMADISQHPDVARPEVAIEVKMLRAYHFMRQDDTASCLQILEPMMREPPPLNTFLSLLLSTVASLALVHANQFERAREVARLRHQFDIPRRPDHPRPLIDIVSGFSHLIQGNINLATPALQSYIEHALQRTSQGVDAAGLFSGYLVDALYQSGQVDQARQFLDRYLDLIDAVGLSDGLLFSYRVRARIQQMDGDFEGARETMLRLEELGYQRRLDRIVAWSLWEQLALSLRTDQKVPARDLLARLERLGERYRDARGCAWSEIGMAVLLARVMVAFLQDPGNPACLAAIDAADAASQRNGRLLPSTSLGLLRAVVLLRNGREDEAVETGRRMVGIAADTGMMRVLPDAGTAMLPLIVRLLQDEADPRRRSLLETAQRELDPSLSGTASAASPASAALATQGAPPRGQVELLSAREHEVLALLAKALSIKSIARALGLSPGTVKWHLKNIYGKLSAISREDALAKARQLRILA
ncbi:hypothetical protein D0B54_07695 [Solimonas sp. K1W22B-7]|uniref:LuxR C-terminal-related transcriptional regulator n=1 Tax=Solimonas sp. K1W22B-7 TaxID=2303331 RepID=UPI000E334B84|nr:LuxR C-terminal-related transcriptional regulator [Solimonas sp. K1W22B-7]AXQ28573.1 hypothetical protein D0B54_07695 [Solimonas sp. K1W22B-7]